MCHCKTYEVRNNIHVHCSALTLTLECQNCIKIQCTYQNYVKHDYKGSSWSAKKQENFRILHGI